MNIPDDAEINAHNLFQSYLRGWTDGSCCRAMKTDFTKHENREMAGEYERGYSDGIAARRKASREAAERLGYKPNVLRAC